MTQNGLLTLTIDVPYPQSQLGLQISQVTIIFLSPFITLRYDFTPTRWMLIPCIGEILDVLILGALDQV